MPSQHFRKKASVLEAQWDDLHLLHVYYPYSRKMCGHNKPITAVKVSIYSIMLIWSTGAPWSLTFKVLSYNNC